MSTAAQDFIIEANWETFCDDSYFHQWAVRPIGDRDFGSQKLFHLPSKQEAEALCNILNSRIEREKGEKEDGFLKGEVGSSVSAEDIIEMIDERIKYLDTIVERGIDQRWYLGGKDELIQLRPRITAKEKEK